MDPSGHLPSLSRVVPHHPHQRAHAPVYGQTHFPIMEAIAAAEKLGGLSLGVLGFAPCGRFGVPGRTFGVFEGLWAASLRLGERDRHGCTARCSKYARKRMKCSKNSWENASTLPN